MLLRFTIGLALCLAATLGFALWAWRSAKTARLATERERLMRAHADAALLRQTEFVALLAHELRQPLDPLVTAALMIPVPDDARSQQLRAIIERQTRQLTRLLDDVTDLSRFQLGKLTIQESAVPLGALVDESVEAIAPLMKSREHEFTSSCSAPCAVLHADATRIKQALSNLLTNAAKYTPLGGAVSLSGDVDDNEVVFRVRDTGRGISADALRTVFDPFRQGPEAEGGLGVGLAVVKAFVEAHGGRAAAFSPGIGCGSEFVIRLPLTGGTSRGFTSVPAGEQR
jgi:signal transduction histidine kinase